jgi:hypothetical protein
MDCQHDGDVVSFATITKAKESLCEGPRGGHFGGPLARPTGEESPYLSRRRPAFFGLSNTQVHEHDGLTQINSIMPMV